MFLVYRVSCLANGKSYIGVTTEGVPARWGRHVRQAKIGGGGVLKEIVSID
jgi:hypothetical protein